MTSYSARKFIQEALSSHNVVIFSKSYCPYCHATKALFSSPAFKSADVVTYEIDTMTSGAEIQRELLTMTGQRTVPSVFVNGQHLGGNDDTQEAHRNGVLGSLLST